MSLERIWVIGAAPDCDLAVDVPTVSAHHCRLIEAPAGFFLEDLHSTNGTYVNGCRIASRVKVQPTDVILLGSKVAMPWPPPRLPSAEPIPAGTTELPEPLEPAARPTRRLPMRAIGAASAVALSATLVIVALVDRPRSGKVERSSSRNASDSATPDGMDDDEDVLETAVAGVTERSKTPVAAAPRVRPHVNSPAKIDLYEIVKPHEQAVVWLGFRLRDYVFPYGTGWFARPDVVVTTASVVSELEHFTRKGWEAVVYHNGTIMTVKSLRSHPEYDPESDVKNPGSQSSVVSNIGVAVLDERVDVVCSLAEPGELAALADDPGVVAVGFESQLAEKEPFDELKVKLFHAKTDLARSEFLASKSSRIYALRIPAPKCCEGSPIFNRRGHVVGVLAVVSDGPRMVPINRLSALLDPPGN